MLVFYNFSQGNKLQYDYHSFNKTAIDNGGNIVKPQFIIELSLKCLSKRNLSSPLSSCNIGAAWYQLIYLSSDDRYDICISYYPIKSAVWFISHSLRAGLVKVTSTLYLTMSLFRLAVSAFEWIILSTKYEFFVSLNPFWELKCTCVVQFVCGEVHFASKAVLSRQLQCY